MTVLKEFFVFLGLDMQGEQFARAQIAVNLLQKGLQFLVEKASEAVEALKRIPDELTNQASELEKASAKTSVHTDALQELAYAANQTADLGLGELTHSLIQLQRHMEEAKKGTGGASEAFKKLGVNVTDASGHLRKPDEVFMEIAESISKMTDEAERSPMAMKLFGRSGSQLVPAFKEGAAALQHYREEAHELGLVMNRDLIEQASKNEEAQKRLTGAWQGIKNIVGGPLLEIAAGRAEATTKWILQNRELLKQFVDKAWIGFREVMKTLGSVLSMVVDIGKGLVNWFISMGPVIGSVITAVVGLTAAMVVFGTASTAAALRSAAAWIYATAPVVALAAVLAAVILIAESLWKSMTTGEGFVIRLGERWEKFLLAWTNEKNPDDWWLTRWIKTALKALLELHKHWQDFVDIFDTKAEDIWTGITGDTRKLSNEELRKMGISPEAIGLAPGKRTSYGELAKLIQNPNSSGNQMFYTTPQRGVTGDAMSEAQDRESGYLARPAAPTVTIENLTVTANGVQDPKALTNHVEEIVTNALTDALKSMQVETAQ